MSRPSPHQLYLFRPPYRLLVPVAGPASLDVVGEDRGVALVWCMASETDRSLTSALRNRPGGVPLIAVLPRAEEITRPQDLFAVVEHCRPHSLLPFHVEPSITDLRALLAQVPEDVPGSLVEYLGWRGLILDLDLRRIIRRVLELSEEVSTVSGLARGLYMSRRALGRRFLKEGLPVPSHWLHFGRLLRVCLDLQKPGASLMSVAYQHGYPDGFSLSNQMKRLFGLRPSDVPTRLGWEWIVEAWIRCEVGSGGFRKDQAQLMDRRRGSHTFDPSRHERQPA